MIYDLIIVGAGAAGLFAGASLTSAINGLILEKTVSPGKKLLMSGAGQCNLTHGGSIKDFISHYGKNGGSIRSILYKYSNTSLMDFFKKRGIELFEREDGKVFPQSLQAQEIVNALVKSCIDNGLKFKYSSPVTNITFEKINNQYDKSEIIYTVHCNGNEFNTKKLIVTTGGCSYPVTGSDGSIFKVLKSIGIEIEQTKPALVPIFVQNYPFKDLSGISFSNAQIAIYSHLNNKQKIKKAENSDGLLLTHTCFSGPAILNISRYASESDLISINYYPYKSSDIIFKELSKLFIGNKKQLLTVLYEYFNGGLQESKIEIPKRFIETICLLCNKDSAEKSSHLSPSALKSIVQRFTDDIYTISSLGGYNTAMATSGGVSLSEVNLKTLESKKFPGLYFAGEVLDVDGDTGGYNLQFAFSSGNLAAKQ